MIIDKVKPYWTEEDRAKLKEIKDRKHGLFKTYLKNETQENYDAVQEAMEQSDAIRADVINRYISSHTKKDLFKDLKEIVGALEQEDFKAQIEEHNMAIDFLNHRNIFKGKENGEDRPLKPHFEENYSTCYAYVESIVRVQLDAIKSSEILTQQAIAIIDERVCLWYDDKPQTPPTFRAIYEGSATNTFTKLLPSEIYKDIKTGNTTIKREKDNNFTLTIPNYENLDIKLRDSAFQLFDILTILATEAGGNNRIVTLSLTDYMSLRGLKDRKSAKEKIEADLALLLSCHIKWDETTIRGADIPSGGATLADSWVWTDKKKNTIQFMFGSTFFDILRQYPVMAYPSELLKINTYKNPNSYRFGRKISELKRTNIAHKNENIISVKTLLKDTKLPTYEEVSQSDRQFTNRIIDPFERDLSVFTSISWEYCHRNNTPLTDEELENLDYKTWESLLIHIIWKNYPELSDLRERRTKRLEEAKQKGQSTTKKRTTRKKKTNTESGN